MNYESELNCRAAATIIYVKIEDLREELEASKKLDGAVLKMSYLDKQRRLAVGP